MGNIIMNSNLKLALLAMVAERTAGQDKFSLDDFADEKWPKESSTMWTAIPKPATSSTIVDKRDPDTIKAEKASWPYVLDFVEFIPKSRKDFWLDGSYSTLINYAGQYQLQITHRLHVPLELKEGWIY